MDDPRDFQQLSSSRMLVSSLQILHPHATLLLIQDCPDRHHICNQLRTIAHPGSSDLGRFYPNLSTLKLLCTHPRRFEKLGAGVAWDGVKRRDVDLCRRVWEGVIRGQLIRSDSRWMYRRSEVYGPRQTHTYCSERPLFRDIDQSRTLSWTPDAVPNIRHGTHLHILDLINPFAYFVAYLYSCVLPLRVSFPD
ncbi:hypothetical protein BJ165DRAFT_1407158 [Panaeolus papilionaceus]|nr:hypothetical protein BJ165DRAFT_1407158 [Panaeolus papilionaceus]